MIRSYMTYSGNCKVEEINTSSAVFYEDACFLLVARYSTSYDPECSAPPPSFLPKEEKDGNRGFMTDAVHIAARKR